MTLLLGISPDAWRRVWGVLLIVVILTPTAAGCASGKDERVEDRLCDVSASSEEGEQVRQVLGAADVETEIYKEDDEFAKKSKDQLRQGGFHGFGYPLEVCSFTPKNFVGAHRLSIEFLWVARDEKARGEKPLQGPASHYNVNGALGEANDIFSQLRVECRLKGDSEKLSDRVLLQGLAANTLLMGTKVKQVTKDQQVGFLYLMLRRATDILGCENDPLVKDPVVTPYGSASEAAAAG